MNTGIKEENKERNTSTDMHYMHTTRHTKMSRTEHNRNKRNCIKTCIYFYTKNDNNNYKSKTKQQNGNTIQLTVAFLFKMPYLLALLCLSAHPLPVCNVF